VARQSPLEGLHQNLLSSRSFTACLLFLCAGTSGAADRWQSPDKFYSIVPPSGWQHSESKSAHYVSYAFKSPDGQAEVRISATSHLNLPDVLPDDLIESGFRNEQGLGSIQRIRGTGWDGLRREYTNKDKTRRWLAVGARRGSTAIFLTMNAPSQEFDRYRDQFESVGRSLQVGQEILSDQDRDYLIRRTLDHFWGEALDSDDKPIQPKDDRDRETIPITTSEAYRVTDAAIPAGVAMWAHLDWEKYYGEFMKKERRTRQWSGKQIAFIGTLFGTVQGWTERTLSKAPPKDEGREWAALALQRAKDDL
jgi:hypothetical protein